ncbi:TonB-dependent receptor [Sediminibacterium ginsengisoli]|uniref:Iron complex outermembrane recepter protein n=1 Tax=Sediminibacterium ginsengisoli TaxID=413434 RepID=A0A1T4L929_9BACT|nr:TonB-dependent receptor [Sediminibacterium ginsengisoli]SJZ51078.1 iron complex outermembrane recepter protein [Sediminibacterium ginsengisoli]
MRPFLLFCLLPLTVWAQQPKADTTTLLEEVTVSSFHSTVRWKEAPAAVAVIGKDELQRYAPVSLVPVLNILPGARMEERSPGSYRLSVRGSLLRSPFGVRNVKVYWNQLPLTDGGGNTYLNLVDMNSITGATLLKGPAASMYGAGTGGVLLLNSNTAFSDRISDEAALAVTGGSFGQFQQRASWQHTGPGITSSLQQVHQQAAGYREQSAMRRDAISWQSAWKSQRNQLRALVFYTDLYYQTPGGLTLAQWEANPVQARPPAGALPGAVQQKAAIYNRTLFAGIQDELTISDILRLAAFVTGSRTGFSNPFITNYEKRNETNFSAGAHIGYHKKGPAGEFSWITGTEWLYNHSAIDNYGNKGGMSDTIQYRDRVHALQWSAFSQLSFGITRWELAAGLSINEQRFRYRRLENIQHEHKTTGIVAMPRFSVLYKVSGDLSLYATAAQGFSPPSLAELRPSDGNYYGDLKAEQGWNYELGFKGYLFNQRGTFDISAYYFRLRDAIVRRNSNTGAEYFVNAGGTIQKGTEARFGYRLPLNGKGWLQTINAWSSYAFQPYYFDDYRQGNADYSGNPLTGVPQQVIAAGLDLTMAKGFYFNISASLVSSLPLNDANDERAKAYQLLQAKAGYKTQLGTQELHVYAGADNLLDQRYSLGNDINAAGRRYYNAAAGRNFFAGISWSLKRARD